MWANETGQGVDDGYFADHIRRICPHFDILYEIFGHRKSFILPNMYDTLDEVDENIQSAGNCNVQQDVEDSESLECSEESELEGAIIVEEIEQIEAETDNDIIEGKNDLEDNHLVEDSYLFEERLFEDDFTIVEQLGDNFLIIEEQPVRSPRIPSPPIPAPRIPASRISTPRIPAPRIPASRIPASRIPAPRIPAPRPTSDEPDDELDENSISRFRTDLTSRPQSKNGFKPAIDKHASNAASVISKALTKRADAMSEKNIMDATWKKDEVQLNRERFEHEKKMQIALLDLKKGELEVK